MRILVFGDSIAYGSWAEYGWVELVKREMHVRTIKSQGATKVQVVNLGIGGDTSAKILKRMTNEIDSRHSPRWPFTLVFSFGTNDARTTDGVAETSPEQFEANIRAIITTAKRYTTNILFVGAPPIGQAAARLSGREFSDERLKAYEERLMPIVHGENVAFLPMRQLFEQSARDDLYAYDHLHPGDAGHELIAAAVLPKLDIFVTSVAGNL